MIPKILVQTTKNKKPPQYVIDKLKYFTGDDWQYQFFTDDDILDFFKEYPADDFPLIEEKFLSIQSGPHKADLFRYYFLYVRGGVYIDADAVLVKDINYLVEKYDFFTVKSEDTFLMFQGFIGSVPGHEIIKAALTDVYNIDNDVLEGDYHVLCKNLVAIVERSKKSGVRILSEIVKTNQNDQFGITSDTDSIPILIHYFRDKVIPVHSGISLGVASETETHDLVIVTVTCTRDKFAMQLLAHTIDLFVVDTCVHYVVIEDNDTSYAEWLTLLLPHHSRHQLKLIHDYNQSTPDEYGYIRHQQIKLQIADQIPNSKYLLLDSKNLFFKPTKLSSWPVGHGNSTNVEVTTNFWALRWLQEKCNDLGLTIPDKLPIPMTPFVIKTSLARRILRENDITQLIDWNKPTDENDRHTPSEFMIYSIYALTENEDIIPEVPTTVWHTLHGRHFDAKLYHYFFSPETLDYGDTDILVFGIHRSLLKSDAVDLINTYYNWLIGKGVNKKILDAAWFGPLFNIKR